MEHCFIKVAPDTAHMASRIHADAWKISYRDFVPHDYLDELSFDYWTEFFKDEERTAYFLSVDDNFVGVVTYGAAREESMAGFGEIWSIYVHPDHHNKGYGRKLLQFAHDKLKELGFDKTYLWVLEENLNSCAFYEAMGYEKSDDKATLNIGGKEIIEVRYIKSNTN